MRRRIPMVMQAEATDCGWAAVTMIACYHGHSLSLDTLRQRYSRLDAGPTLKTLLAVASELDLHSRALRLRLPELAGLALPAILHWQFDHFVVLTRVRRGHFEIHDPARGKRKVSPAEMNEAFTGVAVEFSKADAFDPQGDTARSPFAGLLRSFDGLGGYVALMLGLLLTAQVLTLAPPVATQLLIDELVSGQNKRWLLGVLAGVGLVLLASIVLDALRKRIALYVATHLAIDSSSAVIGHILQLPPDRLRQRSVGDLMTRIDSLAALRRAVTETALNGIVQIVVMASTLALMFFYSATLTLISIVALLLTVLLYAAVLPASRARNLQAVVHGASASNSLIETLRGFESVASLGLRAQRLQHWQNSFVHATNADAGRTRIAIAATAVQSFIAAGDQLLFLGLAVGAIFEGQLTLGVLFAMFALRGRLAAAAHGLLQVVQELYLLRTHLERLYELLEEPREPRAVAAQQNRVLRGAIRCQGLSFHYPGAAPLIVNLHCQIEAGEKVVISAPSGAGKSTLLRLLSAALQPHSGQLFYDELEAGLWDPAALRAQFGVVLQQDRLFQGSLADNISGFDAQPDPGRIREAAGIAGIWSFIASLPMHIHTPVDTAAATLSGGQLQRILLARALYRQPRVLFLDEATAHLDRDNEAQVLRNLAQLDITIVSVAHGDQALALGGRLIQLPASPSHARAV